MLIQVRFSAQLLRIATAPLDEAASLFASGRVTDAFGALAKTTLAAAMDRAVNETAKGAGVKPERVQALLPWSEITKQLSRIGAAQETLLAAWNRHAARVSGFLRGM